MDVEIPFIPAPQHSIKVLKNKSTKKKERERRRKVRAFILFFLSHHWHFAQLFFFSFSFLFCLPSTLSFFHRFLILFRDISFFISQRLIPLIPFNPLPFRRSFRLLSNYFSSFFIIPFRETSFFFLWDLVPFNLPYFESPFILTYGSGFFSILKNRFSLAYLLLRNKCRGRPFFFIFILCRPSFPCFYLVFGYRFPDFRASFLFIYNFFPPPLTQLILIAIFQRHTSNPVVNAIIRLLWLSGIQVAWSYYQKVLVFSLSYSHPIQSSFATWMRSFINCYSLVTHHVTISSGSALFYCG